jgi:hypothetical protein
MASGGGEKLDAESAEAGAQRTQRKAGEIEAVLTRARHAVPLRAFVWSGRGGIESRCADGGGRQGVIG